MNEPQKQPTTKDEKSVMTKEVAQQLGDNLANKVRALLAKNTTHHATN